MIPTFKYEELKDGDAETLLNSTVKMFASLRDFVTSVQKMPGSSDNALRYEHAVPTQAAADARLVYVVPTIRPRITIETVWLSVRSNLGSGTTFSLAKTAQLGSAVVAAHVTGSNGSLVANVPVRMQLAGQEKLVAEAGDYFILTILGNVPAEGIIQLCMREVYQ